MTRSSGPRPTRQVHGWGSSSRRVLFRMDNSALPPGVCATVGIDGDFEKELLLPPVSAYAMGSLASGREVRVSHTVAPATAPCLTFIQTGPNFDNDAFIAALPGAWSTEAELMRRQCFDSAGGCSSWMANRVDEPTIPPPENVEGWKTPQLPLP